jgi:hypothetical protein
MALSLATTYGETSPIWWRDLGFATDCLRQFALRFPRELLPSVIDPASAPSQDPIGSARRTDAPKIDNLLRLGRASITVTAHVYADLYDDELDVVASALDALDDRPSE